jgi:hypothetical protein
VLNCPDAPTQFCKPGLQREDTVCGGGGGVQGEEDGPLVENNNPYIVNRIVLSDLIIFVF